MFVGGGEEIKDDPGDAGRICEDGARERRANHVMKKKCKTK